MPHSNPDLIASPTFTTGAPPRGAECGGPAGACTGRRSLHGPGRRQRANTLLVGRDCPGGAPDYPHPRARLYAAIRSARGIGGAR